MTAKHSLWLVTCLLVAVVAVGDIYLLTHGLPWTQVAEVAVGEPPAAPQSVYRPYPPALLSLGALGVLALGLVRRAWRPLAWLGVGLNVAVGALLIFSLGVVYLAAAGVLVVALSLLEWVTRPQTQWLIAGLVGAAVVMLDGYLFGWTPFGSTLLAVGAGLLVVIVWLGLTHRQSTSA